MFQNKKRHGLNLKSEVQSNKSNSTADNTHVSPAESNYNAFLAHSFSYSFANEHTATTQMYQNVSDCCWKPLGDIGYNNNGIRCDRVKCSDCRQSTREREEGRARSINGLGSVTNTHTVTFGSNNL
jgi:hypothetical protein